MLICIRCNKEFPNKIIINGKTRNLQSRKYCLECSPFMGLHYKRNDHPIWNNKDILEAATNGASTIKEILERLGKRPYYGNYNVLKGACAKYNIILPVFDRTQNANNTHSKLRKPDSVYFCRTINRINSNVVKSRLLSLGIKNECSVCKLSGTWEKKKLVLQLDHVDGDCCNNLIENLRLLCPNCHSQTKSYCRGLHAENN